MITLKLPKKKNVYTAEIDGQEVNFYMGPHAFELFESETQMTVYDIFNKPLDQVEDQDGEEDLSEVARDNFKAAKLSVTLFWCCANAYQDIFADGEHYQRAQISAVVNDHIGPKGVAEMFAILFDGIKESAATEEGKEEEEKK